MAENLDIQVRVLGARRAKRELDKVTKDVQRLGKGLRNSARGMRKALATVIDGFKDIATGIWTIIKGPLQLIGSRFQKVFGDIWKVVSDVSSRIGNTMGDVGSRIGKGIGGAFSRITAPVGKAFSFIKQKVGNVINNVFPGLQDGISKIGGGLGKVLGGLGTGVGAVASAFASVGAFVLPIIGEIISKIAQIGFKAIKVGGLITAGLVGSLMGIGIKTAGDLEQVAIQFESITGSAEEAAAVMNKIKEDARTTPFEFKSLAQLNANIMSTGLSADRSRELILGLGNAVAAAGKGNEELNRMASNLQQIKNLGHATTVDLRQFAFAGIDIYGMLADSMGVTRKEVQAMEATSITFDMIEKALLDAAEGSNILARQSDTLRGRWEMLTESVQFNAAEFVQSSGIFSFVKDTIRQLSLVVDDFFMGLNAGSPLIVESLNRVRDSVQQVATNFGLLNENGEFTADVLGQKVAAGIALVIDFVRSFGETISEYMPQIRDSFGTLGESLVNIFSPQVETVTEKVGDMEVAFTDDRNEAERLGDTAGDIAGGGLTLLVDMFTNIIKWIDENKEAFGEFIDAITGLAKQLTPILDKINNLIGRTSVAQGAINSLVSTAATSAAQSALNAAVGVESGESLPMGPRTFASGGILGGSSPTGDRIAFMGNSGEMVINRQDQQSLFNFIKQLGSQPRVVNNNISGNVFGGNRSEMQQENQFLNLLQQAGR